MKLPTFTKKYSLNRYYGKDRKILILLAISLTLSIILFFIGILIYSRVVNVSGNILTGIDFITFGLITAIGPMGFYNHTKAKKKKLIEDKLPDFLREISSSTASGMTIFDAIIISSKGEHGELTQELEMMASQLTWGLPVDEALENFAKRVNTPAIKRIVITINKSLEIGGNTSTVFDAAAREIDQVKLVQQPRRAEMSLYAMVIFISFFVFLAVILIIDKTIFQAIFDLQGKMPTGGTRKFKFWHNRGKSTSNKGSFLHICTCSKYRRWVIGWLYDGWKTFIRSKICFCINLNIICNIQIPILKKYYQSVKIQILVV